MIREGIGDRGEELETATVCISDKDWRQRRGSANCSWSLDSFLAVLTPKKGSNLLALYFGEDPARCPFEQVTATLLNFIRLFRKAHEENCKQAEAEKKKAEKEAEMEKAKGVNERAKGLKSGLSAPLHQNHSLAGEQRSTYPAWMLTGTIREPSASTECHEDNGYGPLI
ncbi:hypothetical protein RJT34_12385 [Clitoria ternatea]|uniref:Uncharacterized protein n=1 Tax=Clitoria ternatea TaxID=43366 RepID=A0AAN9PKV8_CLITE